METFRLLSYLVGIVFSIVMAGQLLSIRQRLARLFGAVMIAWAINCASLLVLLYILATGAEAPPWRDALLTLNAVLLAAAPTALYFWFPRAGGIEP